MYEMLALLTGLILSVMVSVNGNLSESFGVFRASVIIHVVGILFEMCIRDRLCWSIFRGA